MKHQYFHHTKKNTSKTGEDGYIFFLIYIFFPYIYI